MGTSITQRFPWGYNVKARALCSDGIVRTTTHLGEADTFFSAPAAVVVWKNGKRYTVSGFITVETLEGYSTETDDDPAMVKFIAYQYRKNGTVLPAGGYRDAI